MNKVVIVLIGLALLAGGYMVYRNSTTVTPEEQATEIINETPVIEENENEEEEADIVTIEVGSGMFYFDPEEIRVTEGDTVRIVLTNAEGIHDWVVDEFNARTDIINAGETAEVTFVADTAGTFEYYCSVGDHRARGMVGNLIVEER